MRTILHPNANEHPQNPRNGVQKNFDENSKEERDKKKKEKRRKKETEAPERSALELGTLEERLNARATRLWEEIKEIEAQRKAAALPPGNDLVEYSDEDGSHMEVDTPAANQ
ncbi:hypothetical protein N7528_004343 [Penicillium herquei]|nr:hypothetical protein N7528_004343 [Penicillium herquei]